MQVLLKNNKNLNTFKSNKYFMLFDSLNKLNFIAGVKYKVKYETPQMYCIKNTKTHNDYFINKNRENIDYITGLIQTN